MSLLRSALFNVWFYGLTAGLGVVGVVVRAVAPHRALGFARAWAGLVIGGARVLCGIRVEVTGLEKLPPGAALLASQHQSAFDTLIWAVLLPEFAYVYKAELGRIPLFGPMLRAAGQIPLDRAASVTAVRAMLRAAQKAAQAGRRIVIFPEGTRVAFGEEAPIRAGFAIVASRTGLPIYPIATDSGRCWGRRAFRKRAGTIHIRVGDPISPTLPPAALIHALRERWREEERHLHPVDNSVEQAVTGGYCGAASAAVSTDFDRLGADQESAAETATERQDGAERGLNI